jgi:hypothetical protein
VPCTCVLPLLANAHADPPSRLFCRILPWGTTLRVWDVFFFEGPPFILRTALAIVRIVRDSLMDARAVPGHGEALQLLLHPGPHSQLSVQHVIEW